MGHPACGSTRPLCSAAHADESASWLQCCPPGLLAHGCIAAYPCCPHPCQATRSGRPLASTGWSPATLPTTRWSSSRRTARRAARCDRGDRGLGLRLEPPLSPDDAGAGPVDSCAGKHVGRCRAVHAGRAPLCPLSPLSPCTPCTTTILSGCVAQERGGVALDKIGQLGGHSAARTYRPSTGPHPPHESFKCITSPRTCHGISTASSDSLTLALWGLFMLA